MDWKWTLNGMDTWQEFTGVERWPWAWQFIYLLDYSQEPSWGQFFQDSSNLFWNSSNPYEAPQIATVVLYIVHYVLSLHYFVPYLNFYTSESEGLSYKQTKDSIQQSKWNALLPGRLSCNCVLLSYCDGREHLCMCLCMCLAVAKALPLTLAQALAQALSGS